MLHTKKELSDQILNQTLKSDYEAVLIESQKLQKRLKEELTVIKLKAKLYSVIIIGKLQKLQKDELTIIKQETQIKYKTAVKDLQKQQKKELLAIKQQAIYDRRSSRFQIHLAQKNKDNITNQGTVLSQTSLMLPDLIIQDRVERAEINIIVSSNVYYGCQLLGLIKVVNQ